MKIKRPAYYDLDFASELEARWYVLFAEQGVKVVLHPAPPEGETFPVTPSLFIDDYCGYALVVAPGGSPRKEDLARFLEFDDYGLWILEGPPADKLYDGCHPSLHWQQIPTPEFKRALAIALSIQFK